jgi:protein Mpv17
VQLDFVRLGRMVTWGAAFAPLAHVWYAQLDKIVTGKSAMAVASKVTLDQLTWTPVINSLFFFSTTMMTTADVGASTNAVTEKLWPTLKVNWVVWPVLQVRGGVCGRPLSRGGGGVTVTVVCALARSPSPAL